MKTSRKISFVLLAAMLSIGFANAQLGIQAGYSNSKDANSDAALNGFHAGLVYNLPLTSTLGHPNSNNFASNLCSSVKSMMWDTSPFVVLALI